MGRIGQGHGALVDVLQLAQALSQRPLVGAARLGAPGFGDDADALAILMQAKRCASGRRALGGVLVPLNFDQVFIISITGANVPPFVDTYGTFDAGGQSQASFVVSEGLSPNIAGFVISFSALILDGGTVLGVSPEPVTLELTE